MDITEELTGASPAPKPGYSTFVVVFSATALAVLTTPQA